MCDDRTSEFLSLARNLPQGGVSSAPSLLSSSNSLGRYGGTPGGTSSSSSSAGNNNNNGGAPYEELKAFHKTASDISKDIASTSAMLSELSQLIKTSRNSIFVEQDSSHQINSLVLRIKANIENLNGRLDQAGTFLSYQKRKLNTQAGQQATNLVGQLKEEFVQATAGFKQVLQQRTDVLKETTDRKRQVYGGSANDHHANNGVSLEFTPPVYDKPSSATPAAWDSMGNMPTLDLTSGMTTGEPTGTLPRPHGAPSSPAYRRATSEPLKGGYPGNNAAYLSGATATPLTPLDIQRMEQESQQVVQLIPDQDYLRERAEAMSTVESNIVELGTIFNKLAVMVSEHRDLVQRVEDNVDDANANINLSLSTLTDTLTSLQTNRALLFKIFSILVVFIIAFIIFFA